MTIASSTLSTKVKEGGRWRGSVDEVDKVDSLYRQLKPCGIIHRLGSNRIGVPNSVKFSHIPKCIDRKPLQFNIEIE